MAKARSTARAAIASAPSGTPAFAYVRAPGGWQVIEYAINDDGTWGIVWQGEPNVRDLARSEFRTRVGRHWLKLEQRG